MKVTKYIHSCLLVKDQGKTVLIDPGSYTYQAQVLDINSLESLDYILITHEHQDHMSLPFIKELVAKFPEVQIISNPKVVEILAGEGIKASSEGNEFIELEDVPHEKMFDKPTPDPNVMFRIFNKLSHPGDSFHFELQTPILAMPIQAPWGSLTEAVEVALKLKPEIIIPIHDYHWSEQSRETQYKRLEDFFAKNNIKFIPAQTGEEIEI